VVQGDDVKLVHNDRKYFRELHGDTIISMMMISAVGPARQRHVDVSQLKVLIFEELLIGIRDTTKALWLPIRTLHNTAGS
jgi:hypothetical protein